MIIFANLLKAVAVVLDLVLSTLLFIVILRAIISWVNPDPYNPIVRFLVGTTEPFLKHLRKAIPVLAGRIDFSPLVLILVIYFLQYFLVATLNDYAAQIRRSVMGSTRYIEGGVDMATGEPAGL